MYTLRYLPGTPLNERKHKETLVKTSDYGEAVAALEASPLKQLLEIVER